MNLPKNLILKQFENGPIGNFQYLLGDERTKEVAVIDPAWDMDIVSDIIKKNGYKVVSVFLTHGHPDHVNGLTEILKRHNVPAYISKHEAPFYKPNHKNIIEIENHAKLKIGDIEFEFILAPGHTPGCQLIKHSHVIVSGDVIFIDGCGRCDLPGGDARKMYHSLYEIVMKLPDDTVIFPGHNYGPTPYATVKSQKETNPYLQCNNMEEFLMERMGISS